jgi:hypothetical protein
MSYVTGQEAIVLEVISRLDAGLPAASPPLLPIPGILPAHRSASLSLDDDSLPTFVVVVVENSEDDSQPQASPSEKVYRRCAWVWVEARVVAPPADLDGAPDKFLDPYVDYVCSVLLSDERLGGRSDRMELDRVQYQSFAGRQVYCAAGLLFRVYYLGNPI